jgi:Flp pilus assembly protein CpaB
MNGAIESEQAMFRKRFSRMRILAILIVLAALVLFFNLAHAQKLPTTAIKIVAPNKRPRRLLVEKPPFQNGNRRSAQNLRACRYRIAQ